MGARRLPSLRRAILVLAALAFVLGAAALAGEALGVPVPPSPAKAEERPILSWVAEAKMAPPGILARKDIAWMEVASKDIASKDVVLNDVASNEVEWKDIERAARDGRPETRAWAVRQAAARGDKQAWTLVVEALRDPQAVVGDEALLVLAKRADEAQLSRLAPLLSERDRLVRARLAELLGRATAEVRVAWLRALAKDADGEVARCALSALLRRVEAGRVQGEGRAEAVDTARQGMRAVDPVLAGLALRLAWRLAPDAAEEAVRASLREADAARRAVAVDSLQACTQVLALDLALPALEDRAPNVRSAAIAVLGSLRHRGALRAMVERLAREPQPRLRHRLRLELARVLGVDRGEDQAAWAAGVESWTGGVATRSTGSELRPTTKAHFSGLPLVSDRVAFLVDLSGSMWSAKVGELTRKELVDRALAAALESLPRGARVQLVPYTARPIPWERAAVPLDSARLRQALAWFVGRRDSGPGDFLEAFELVLADEQVDSVCVLTDGVPTGGERHELGLLFDRLLDRNAPRQLAVDALLVDCRPAIAARWSSFCAATGGVARRISYEDLLGAMEPGPGRGGAARRAPEGPAAGRDGVADEVDGE